MFAVVSVNLWQGALSKSQVRYTKKVKWWYMIVSRILLLLSLGFLLTSSILSSTYAQYTDVYSGNDKALIAKWNMGARGEDDIEGEFYNKGFTFDLFDSHSVVPMDYGMKSFTFRGGGSDVAIAYDVKMNAADLMQLTTDDEKAVIAKEAGKDVCAPFIFKITAEINEGAVDTAPVIFTPYDETSPYYDTGWFRPKDIAPDEEGYFSIFSGAPEFSTGSNDQVTVTVHWQWNTSFYINDTDVAAVTGTNAVTADPATEVADSYLPYYQAAYDVYYGAGGLQDQYVAATNAVDQYLEVHGSPDVDGNWPPHYTHCILTDAEHDAEYAAIENEEDRQAYFNTHGGVIDDETGIIIWPSHNVLCTEDHIWEYMDRIAAAEDALEACQTSLMAAYDDYDTFAADALHERESVKVLFRVSGDQIAPE
jgi:hypothetical protein